MLNDPLSEAREALREIWRENSHGATANAGWISKRAEEALARLDALPAPVYRENVLAHDFGLSGQPRGGWIYPDAPRACAEPVIATNTGPPLLRDMLGTGMSIIDPQPSVAREDGGEDAG